jgi:hypothetical protein
VLQSPRDQHVDYSAGLITVQSNRPAVRGKAEGKLQRHDSSGSFANNNGVSEESREQITRAAFQKLYSPLTLLLNMPRFHKEYCLMRWKRF